MRARQLVGIGTDLRALQVVLVAALVLTGCNANLGVSSVLNLVKVRAHIARVTRRHAGVPAHVTCPDSVRLQKGNDFDCVAKFPVGRVRVHVVQTDKHGHVRYEFPPYKLLDMPSLAFHLERRLGAHLHQHVTVLCPQPVLERAGENFTCLSAAADGTQHKIIVTQTGAATGPAFEIL